MAPAAAASGDNGHGNDSCGYDASNPGQSDGVNNASRKHGGECRPTDGTEHGDDAPDQSITRNRRPATKTPRRTIQTKETPVTFSKRKPRPLGRGPSDSQTRTAVRVRLSEVGYSGKHNG